MKKKYVALVGIIMSVAVIFNLITTQDFFRETFNINFEKKGSSASHIDIGAEDGYYYSEFFKINSSSWNNLNLENSAYTDIEDFLIKMDDLVYRIADYTNLEAFDNTNRIQINFVDLELDSVSMKMPKNENIVVERDLFENNTYCFEKDIYSLIDKDDDLGLNLGYGYYLNSFFKENIVYPTYGVDIYVFIANKIMKYNEYSIKSLDDILDIPDEKTANSIENYIAVNYGFVKFLIEDYGFDNFNLLINTKVTDNSFYEIYGKRSSEIVALFVEKIKNAPNYLYICKDILDEIDDNNLENIGLEDFSNVYNGVYTNSNMYTLNFSFNSYIFEEYGYRKFSALDKYNYDYYLIYDKTLTDLKSDWLNSIENYNDSIKK